MGVNLTYLDGNQGVVFTCYGLSTGDELKDALRRVAKKESIEKLKYALIDETAVTSYVRTGFDTLDFVKLHKYISISVHDDAIVAVVAPSKEGYGLALAWEIEVAEVGWVTKSFKVKDEAEAWIKAQMKELFDTDINFTK
jgi:hypothetical protein